MIDNHKLTSAIIAAAGSGTRMKSDISKQFISVGGIPVIVRTLSAFDAADEIDEVIVVTKPEDIPTILDMTKKYNIKKVVSVICGGETRQASVRLGLEEIKGELVLIHDGARPFVTPEQINFVAKALYDTDAAALGIPVKDTLKEATDDGFIAGTHDRTSLYSIQTPQGFKTDILRLAHNRAEANHLSVTDDCALCENMGVKIKIIEGSSSNIKITTPDDLILAEGIIKGRQGDKKMRVGFGYDVHKLVEGIALIIGGVEIPYELGLLGHSDADVLLHAIMDAMLGAAALGDIGKHFPDTDNKWKGADSKKLLAAVADLLRENGASVINIDATIIAQSPKMAPHIPDMIDEVSRVLNLPRECINIKATTTEKLGFCGRGEGLAAEAVCTIEM